ncbi:MAG: HAD family hydrolase [Actinomycetes bacterium]
MTGATPATEAVVFDLDGVLRHWNDHLLDEVEIAYGLEPRTIMRVAFGSELGRLAITGVLPYREWMDEIRRRVVAAHGSDCLGALDEWESNVGVVDTEMLSVIRRVRQHATVALLSNGTTRLRRDLHVLNLLDEFDVIFNTAELGVAKPDPVVFRTVIDALGVTPEASAFIDDMDGNVAGAASVGIAAHQHRSPATTASFLSALGLPI